MEDGLGADISWKNRDEVTNLILEQRELERLSEAIAATSEETTEPYDITGLLTGAVIGTKRFTFTPDGGDDISGTFVDAISEEHTVTLPKRYHVKLEKITKIQYSSEEPRITWHLLSLTEVR